MKLRSFFRLQKKPNNIRKILFITLSNLGDVILTLPTLQSLRSAYPEAVVDVVVGPGGKIVFEGDARIHKLTVYEKKGSWSRKYQELLKIRQEKYDMVVDLRRSLFGLLSGARYRNAYFQLLPSKNVHRAVRHRMSLGGLASLHYTRPFLEGRPKSSARPEYDFLSEFPSPSQKLVVVAPGSKSDLKKWPAPSYALLLDRLSLTQHCRVVLVGDKADIADAKMIAQAMTVKPINLCGQTDFAGLLDVIERADLVITNDSAPLHIADALRRPTLAIFGPTDPRKYGPRYRHSQVARRTLFCAPCEKAQCRYAHECMTQLGVDEVYTKALSILNDVNEQKNIRILVTRLDRIGDLVLSLPAIELIRYRFPNAYIAVMTRPATADLLQGHPSIDEVIPYYYENKGCHSSALGNIRFIREISKRGFDISFILHPSLRSYMVSFFAGIPYRVGFATKMPGLLTHPVADRRFEGTRHESEYTLDVVRGFGLDRPDKLIPKIFFSAEHEAMAEKCLSGVSGTMIALHAGASCPSKRWPKERFAEAALEILRGCPEAYFVIVGGEAEKELGEYLQKTITRRVIDLTAKLSLKELAAVLARASLVISNDSGPVHIAAAVGARTLTIFGRSLPGLSTTRWKALGEGHAYIRKDVGCAVCLAHRCTIGFECLAAVSSREVAQKALSMLEQKLCAA